MLNKITIIFFFACIVAYGEGFAQQANATPASQNVYALVIGISQYANNGIPRLSFAHKDAEVFADYLRSPAGGKIAEEHLRVLLNEQATYAAIYEAINWLMDSCKENDLVYFYFSGHGDVENFTIYKMGFLLSYDTPKSNYINNALRLDDLNAFANTLSVKSKARVVIITDACHSGKLSGSDFRGNMLVGEQLKAVKSQEVRITSCSGDELSVEDEGWGGGRGVFSYYLVNGLEGLADQQDDGNVTGNEIEKYLSASLSGDALLAQKDHKQNPNVTGNKSLRLAKVDMQMKQALQHTGASMPLLQSQLLLKPLAKPAQAYFFELFDSLKIEEVYDFKSINSLAAEEIPFAFLTSIPSLLEERADKSKFSELTDELKHNPDALKRFINKMVVMLSNRGQEVINAYLEGDEAELERRRYYNSNNNGYDKYPQMFSVALKLAKPGSDLARILQIKQYYFTGIAARLKIPLVPDPDPLINEALAAQLKAYELEPNAAYIQNELGVLYYAKNDITKATQFFTRATQIAPKWSIPLVNLSELYRRQKQFDKALELTGQAIAMQPNLQGSYIAKGLIYEEKRNLLLAEELFRKSIRINSRHYLPFERLAYVYMNSTEYALADSFFFEADQRKKGFYFHKTTKMLTPLMLDEVLSPLYLCQFDFRDIEKNPLLGNFTWAISAFYKNDTTTAESKFRKVIELDHTEPLAYHYLGIILFRQKRWKEADAMFRLAEKYYLVEKEFTAHIQQLIKTSVKTRSTDCFVSMYKGGYYESKLNDYILASIYKQWGHYGEAEMRYRRVMQQDSFFIGGYQALWLMFEDMGRYADAENIIKLFAQVDMEEGNRALNAYYKRMIERFPSQKEVYYHAGAWLYDLVVKNPGNYPADQKTILPDHENETFVINHAPTNFIKPVVLPGSLETFEQAHKIERPLTDAITYLKMADSLYEADETLAEINQKIGDLLVWQGIGEKAIPWYKRSVRFQPVNANTRIKLIQTSSDAYQLSDAMAQLDSLNVRQQINFEMQALLAKYSMHAARFKQADTLLNEASNIFPYHVPEVLELQARLHLLQNDDKVAIELYKELRSYRSTNATVAYTIAALYAKSNNSTLAMQWLQTATREGFNYSWVLKADERWRAYRSNSAWKQAIKTMDAKQYVSDQ